MRELRSEELCMVSGGKHAATNVLTCGCGTKCDCGSCGAWVSYDNGNTFQWENF